MTDRTVEASLLPYTPVGVTGSDDEVMMMIITLIIIVMPTSAASLLSGTQQPQAVIQPPSQPHTHTHTHAQSTLCTIQHNFSQRKFDPTPLTFFCSSCGQSQANGWEAHLSSQIYLNSKQKCFCIRTLDRSKYRISFSHAKFKSVSTGKASGDRLAIPSVLVNL